MCNNIINEIKIKIFYTTFSGKPFFLEFETKIVPKFNKFGGE